MTRGLSSQAASLLCSGLKIDPVERATAQELVSSSFWQQSSATSTAASASDAKVISSSAMLEMDEILLSQARERLSKKFELDLPSSGSGTEQDSSLISLLPATRWIE
jgi:hypothetical protein